MVKKYTKQDIENILARSEDIGYDIGTQTEQRLRAGASSDIDNITKYAPHKTSDQTPDDVLGLYTPETAQEKELSEAEEAAFKQTQYKEPDETAIREGTLTRFQSEIDALNKAAAAQKAELGRRLGIQSEEEVGSQRALLAGAGMLGQVSGAAEKSTLQTAQEERLQAGQSQIDTATQQAVSALMSEARRTADKEIAAKQAAYSGSPGALVDYLKNRQAKTETNISNIVQSALLKGVDLSKEDAVADLAATMGVKASDISNTYKYAKSSYDAQVAEKQRLEEKEAADLAKTQAETTETEAETVKKLAEAYKLRNPEDNLITVDGGIYNASTGTWIRSPREKNDEYIFDKDGNIFNKTKGVYATTGTVEAPGKAAQDTAGEDSIITNIDSLLEQGSGILEAVGPNVLARIGLGTLTGKTQSFIGSVEKIVSTLTLENLIAAKSRGATFGALSEKELGMLAAAATKIGTWKIEDKDGRTKGYNIDETSFKNELNVIRAFAEKAKMIKQGTGSTKTPQKQVNYQGQTYNVDAMGEMTLAE